MALVYELVQYDDTEDFVGYKLVVSTEHGEDRFPFVIENRSLCCEEFGVTIEEEQGCIMGKRLESITSQSNNDDSNEEYSEVFLIKTTDGSSTTIKIFNNHNGYYRHTYRATYFRDEQFRVDEDEM